MMFRLGLRLLWLTLLLSSWSLAAAQTGKRQALVVGLSSYAPPRPGRGGVSHLPTGHRDAQRTSDRLKALGWDVTLLTSVPGATDSGAKKADILNALRKLGKNSEDQVLVVYSGHGFRVRSQDYLTAFDTYYDTTEETPKLVVDSLISVDKDLREVFSTMAARRRLLVVDACRDNPNTETKGDGQSSDAGNLASKLGEVVGLSREGSVFAGVLFSCAPLERSYVDGDLDGGKGASVFTEGLLAALSDPMSTTAGVLRPESVAVQSATFVKAWAARRNKKMNPRWVPSPDNDLTLGFELGELKTVTGGTVVVLPTRARLGVEGAPAGAKLSVDGVAQPGLTYEVEVGAGGKRSVKVEVSATGYQTIPYQVTLEAGAYTPIRADLKPVEVTPSPNPLKGVYTKEPNESPAMLLQREDVQGELKVSRDQKPKLGGLQDKMRDLRREMFTGAGAGERPDPAKMQEMMAKVNEEVNKEVASVLTADQSKRLKELTVQRAGASAVMMPDIQKELAITADQKSKIENLQSLESEANRALIEKLRSFEITREQVQEITQNNRKVLDREIMKLLTDTQKTKLKEMAGKPFTFAPDQPRNG